MLKSVATSTRSLPFSTSRAAKIVGHFRLLHGVNDVSKRGPALEDVGLVGVKNGKSRRRFELPKTTFKDKGRPPLPATMKGTKKWSSKGSGRYKNSLAAQSAVRPAVQAARVKEICETEGVDAGIAFVTSCPIDTVNSVVWNTLISRLMRAEKRKRAYDMFIEMKRRGISPTARTFRTLLSGMDEIPAEDWPKNTLNLQRCHKLYEAVEEYAKTCSERTLDSERPFLLRARSYYIRILGKTNDFQKIVEIVYNSGGAGALPRDKELYGSLFRSLLLRKEADLVGNLTSVAEQNASDARSYWRALEKDVESGMTVDAYVVAPFLKIMAGGRPTDHQFGLNVARDFLGLAPPGEDAPPPRLQLCNRTLHAVLELCNKAKKFRLCTYFLKQVTDQTHQRLKVPSIALGYRHINEQLIALGQLAAVGSFDESEKAVDAIRYLRQATALETQKRNGKVEDYSLTRETVSLALGVCWRCGDWERATTIFSLATDLSPEMFLDDGPIASGSINEPKERHYPNKLIFTSAFTHLARTALGTRDKSKMRQCLRMMWYHGIEASDHESHTKFYKSELAKATIRLVEAVEADWSRDEVKMWKDMKRESILSKQSNVKRPEKEEGGLGSEKYLGKLQQAIDFELSAR